jgi:hypothetical protein
METREYLTVQGAAETLHTNRRRIWQLIDEGELHPIPNPLDGRSKLIPTDEIERLRVFAAIRQTAAQNRQAAVEDVSPGAARQEISHSRGRPWPKSVGLVGDPVTVHSDELEDYMREHWRVENTQPDE